MPSVRVAVRYVSLAIFVGVFGYAGLSSGALERYLGVASAEDADIERAEQKDTVLTYAPFGFDRALIVKPTKRADIVTVSAAEPDAGRLHRSILAYVSERNPRASMRAFRRYPSVLVDEAARTNIDHCLSLAQAQTESNFRPDAVGAAGEIGLYQIMPSTAMIFEPRLGKLRKPSLRKHERDLGDLADPVVSTRFAMAYLRDILARKPSVRDALTEYNGGPRGRQPHYYRTVMANYVEILERPELGCRFRERQARPVELARR
ncbi:MAG TPA: transglycosylase SLT domain-containing protein [Methylomirabilota bacterium]|nr:transglycosylase SLT domain-containing protein [Methylomirabilota bacterium]